MTNHPNGFQEPAPTCKQCGCTIRRHGTLDWKCDNPNHCAMMIGCVPRRNGTP